MIRTVLIRSAASLAVALCFCLVSPALSQAPDEYFSGKERGEPWPFDVDGHSAYHRVRDLEAAVKTRPAPAPTL